MLLSCEAGFHLEHAIDGSHGRRRRGTSGGGGCRCSDFEGLVKLGSDEGDPLNCLLDALDIQVNLLDLRFDEAWLYTHLGHVNRVLAHLLSLQQVVRTGLLPACFRLFPNGVIAFLFFRIDVSRFA